MKTLIVFLLLVSSSAMAGEHFLAPGRPTSLHIAVDIEKGAMFLFPKTPRTVTGKTRPNFQVEVYGDKMMVTPLRSGARTNLFIDFGDNMIVTVQLVAVAGGGEDLVHFVLKDQPVKKNPVERIDLPTDFRFLVGPWTVRKVGASGRTGALVARVEYLIAANDRVLFHLKLSNKGHTPLTVADITVSIETLGGLKGTTALTDRSVPASFHLENATLAQGERVFGMVMISQVSLDHDQVLVLRVAEENVPGPEVRVFL